MMRGVPQKAERDKAKDEKAAEKGRAASDAARIAAAGDSPCQGVGLNPVKTPDTPDSGPRRCHLGTVVKPKLSTQVL